MLNLSKIILFAISIMTTQSPIFAQNISEPDLTLKLKNAIDTGQITFKLTEMNEIQALLGDPHHKKTYQDGGMLIMELTYPKIELILVRFKKEVNAPFTLFAAKIEEQSIHIGRNNKLVLRGNHDLSKLDEFQGFQNITLNKVNLRDKMELIQRMSFDNLTEWPPQENLPPNFKPDKILESHKTPGLNIRKLHAQGITGKGVGIAIIDQPLLLNHNEYTSQIIRYDATDLLNIPPKMHGSPIVSIAVGKHIGVAPHASVSYFAVPMWKNDNTYYINALDKIFNLNKNLPETEKIRIISISDGRFSSNPQHAKWQAKLIEAEEKGILVVTCDPTFMNYGTLNTIEGMNPDNANNYTKNKYASATDILRVPAGNRTLASHRGINVYVFDRNGGKSWAAPYIAGLAALAFQINPDISPAKIKTSLIKTAVQTTEGPIINPIKFIQCVKKATD